MKALITSLLFLQLLSCQSQSDKMNTKAKMTPTDTLQVGESLPLDSLWHELVFTNGGCLTGGQHVNNGHFGNEGCIMSAYKRKGKKWELLFSTPKDELTTFLLAKLSDTTTTKIHTCPCMNARNGEVAVYALQSIYKKNWYNLDGFTQYASKESSGCADNEQAWLWEILANQEQRQSLSQQWKNQLEK